MADFYQNGIITTLHNIVERPTAELEAELEKHCQQRPLALVLPSLYSEIQGPALGTILDQISQVNYLNEVVIGLDRANEQEYQHARDFFGRLPQQHRILWNDGPNLQKLHGRIAELGLAPLEPGKGRNAWYCLGYVLARGQSKSVALHDCDILTYDRGLLARLFYPVAHTGFNYAFCKGYYARAAEGKINGRVSRLLVTPLLRALNKVFGQLDYLEYLDSYRYPLAGEFSMRTDVINDLRIPSDWGLEIGVLSEMYRNYSTRRICQVDIARTYDHKHQPLSEGDQSGGLSKMSIDICKAIFRKLATEGITFNTETFRTIKACYYRVALDFIDSYRDDALLNGLSIDIHAEEKAVELFANNVVKAGSDFLDRPHERPFIPSWNRVISAWPEVLDELQSAVEADHVAKSSNG